MYHLQFPPVIHLTLCEMWHSWGRHLTVSRYLRGDIPDANFWNAISSPVFVFVFCICICMWKREGAIPDAEFWNAIRSPVAVCQWDRGSFYSWITDNLTLCTIVHNHLSGVMHFHFTNGIQGCQQKFDRLLKYHRSRKYVPRDMGIFFCWICRGCGWSLWSTLWSWWGGLHHR